MRALSRTSSRTLSSAGRVIHGPSGRSLSSASASTLARERRLLHGVLASELKHQDSKRQALERQLERIGYSSYGMDEAEAEKAAAKHRRRIALVPQRLGEVVEHIALIALLQERAQESSSNELPKLTAELKAIGLGGKLEAYDIDAQPLEKGRPAGFQGLVLESPRAVPILVGRHGFR